MQRSFALIALPLLPCIALSTACRAKEKIAPAPSTTSTTTIAAAASAAPSPKLAAAPVCPRLDSEKIAPLATCGTNVVKAPVPELVDPANTMGPFYERLAELERASAGGGGSAAAGASLDGGPPAGRGSRPLRVAIYGDSNLTSDFLPGHLRRVLQARYGDAGHGWISLSRPWGSYRHEDVVMLGYWPMFKLYAPTTHVVFDKQYGFANMAAQSSEPGAAAWAGTTKDAKALVGKTVSRFELHYLKQPRGGSFRVEIDRKELRKLDTKADAFEVGIETFDVEEGPHELRCVVVGDGPVRLFGTSLDRASTDASKPGFQIDSLGAGALNYERLTWVANDTRRVQLTHRAYDLVVIWLGMNVMFVPPNKDRATEFIGEVKAALPSVPILILGPGDTVREGETKSDPRIVAVSKQMRGVAADTGVAFWDFREAMGGDGAIIGFTKRGLTGEDHIHFGPEGSHLMADRLLCALSSSFSAHLGAHPQAGCSDAPAPTSP